jgi:hypothetical protein
MTPEQLALKERAERLGYKFRIQRRRHGLEHNLTHSEDDTGFGGTDTNSINLWLDVLEHKISIDQFNSLTGCQLPPRFLLDRLN